MTSLYLVLGLMLLLIVFMVRWALREDRRRRLGAGGDAKEGLDG